MTDSPRSRCFRHADSPFIPEGFIVTSLESSPEATNRAPARQLVPLPRVSTEATTRASRCSTFFGRVRAWMVVLPIDLLLLLAPLLWTPLQMKAIVTMALLSLVLLTGGGRYRARLHLSILDELPILLARLLTAAAAIATVTALRHEQADVTTFLINAAIVIRLVVV